MQPSAALTRSDAPRVPSDVIARPRLIAALESTDALTVLRGASGMGKTVALAEWTRASASTVVWVAPGPDGSSASLAQAVLRALVRRGLAPAASEGSAADRSALQAVDVWRVVAAHLAEVQHPLVLVLDDAADQDRESVFDICRTLAAAPDARLIVATSRRSPFDSDGLDLMIDRTVIGPDDLLFDEDEISRALHIRQLEAAQVLAATGGFPALIHAASKQRVLGDPSSVLEAASPAVAEYLRPRLERSGVDADALAALTRISIADAVDAATARALTGADDIERILDDAETFGIGRRSADGVFSLVPVARALLHRGLVDARADEIPGLMRTAVDGALARRAPMDALRLAVEHDDLPLASHVIMSGWTQLLESHGPEAVRLLRGLPISRLKDQPLIAMLLAICYIASKLRRLRGLQLLRVAISAANSRRNGLGPTERVFIWAAESAALRLIGMSERAAQVASKALNLYRETPESIWEPYAVEMPLLCTHLGISLYYGGREDAAVECFEYAASLGASHDMVKAYHAIALLSGIHALNGDMPEARHYAELIHDSAWGQEHLDGYRGTLYRVAEAFLSIEDGDVVAARAHVQVFGPHRSTSEHWLIMGIAEAWVALHEGRAAAGLEQLDSLCRLRGREGAGTHARQTLSRARTLLHLAAGDQAAAREVLRQDARPDTFDTLLERARLALVEGQASEAARMLAQTRRAPATSRQRAETVAVQVAALRRTAGDAAARKTAETLLVRLDDRELTTPVGLLDPEDVGFLREFLTDRGAKAVPGRGVFPATSERPRLSSRERVVLRALTSGASLQSIAADLNVSPNTLKTQLRSIYRKLDARNRAEAIEKAAAYDLLAEH